jgi:hypothetical protein
MIDCDTIRNKWHSSLALWVYVEEEILNVMTHNEDERSYVKVKFMCKLFPRLKQQANPAGWLVTSIKWYLKRYRQSNCLVPIPVWYWRYQKRNGNCPNVEYINVEDTELHAQENSDFAFFDMAESLITDPIDRMIIEGRLRGYNDYEIAKRTGLKRTRITMRKKRIRDRLDKLIKAVQ